MVPVTALYRADMVIVCRAADERKDGRWTGGKFFVPAAESIESSTPHGDKRRAAIYRSGVLIGGSAQDERTAVGTLAHGATAARPYTEAVR